MYNALQQIIPGRAITKIVNIIIQAIKQKDMKIRDLSGRKRLDDKDLDRRIKDREKAVFSILGMKSWMCHVTILANLNNL